MTGLETMALGRKLGHVYEERLRPVCRKYGLTRSGMDVLLFLANHPENNTARDLCAVRGMKSGIASVAVDELLEKGLLRVEVDAEDRRLRRLWLTREAGAAAAAGQAVQARFAAQLGCGIDEEDRAVFERVLAQLGKNAEAMRRDD